MVSARSSNLLGKITVLILICLVMVGLCINTAVALNGSGTEEDPWLIQSLDDFNDFAADANYWDDYTRLETDVNLAGMVYDRAFIAPDWDNAFTGVFDGNDHKITNLTIDSGGNNYLGLFGRIDSGEVRNIGLEGGSVSGKYFVGGLVGENYYGNVSNCYFNGSVTGGWYVGGLIGSNNFGSILNCYSTGDVNGITFVGGLIGDDRFGGSISNCYFTGSISGGGNVGGLVGCVENGTISNCYFNGSVNGGWGVGGLVGYFFNDSISNCYSTGDVSGVGAVGGLVGQNKDLVTNCFWDIDTQTHGVTESIGENLGTVINVAGLPTSDMQTRNTFTDADWDFINVWNIGENQTYPYLRVYLAGDINHDRIVNLFDFAIVADQWMEEQ